MSAATSAADPVQPTHSLTERTVVVTGAAQGQGRAEAELLVAAGAHVVVADILEEAGKQAVSELGDRASFVHLDVADEGSWSAVVDALSALPPLRGLVNNAGVHWFKEIHDEDAASLERMLRINVIGPQIGTRLLAPLLKANGGGSIVNVASVLGVLGARRSSSYVTSKFALRGLTKATAAELGGDGIRVNAILPGYIETPMLGAAAQPGRTDAYYEYLPLARQGQVAEVAELVLYLLSDASSYVTGADIAVDGGMTAIGGPK